MEYGLISVIIPVFNVEEYLQQCVDSVINQTYTNLEIILVDDGSTDKSSLICDNYVKKDARIRVIHKKNEGAAKARNTGLDVATGNYIAFVDSDDWIEPEMYQELCIQLNNNRADIAYGIVKRIGVEEYENIPTNCNTIIQGREILDAYIGSEHTLRILKSVADKLYTRDIIGCTRFIQTIHGEDGAFNMELMTRCQKVVFISKIFYHYRNERSGNISSQWVIDRLFTDRIPVTERNILLLESVGRHDLTQKVLFYLYNELIDYYKEIYKSNMHDRSLYLYKTKQEIKKDYSRLLESMKYKQAGLKYKVKIIIFLLFICWKG